VTKPDLPSSIAEPQTAAGEGDSHGAAMAHLQANTPCKAAASANKQADRDVIRPEEVRELDAAGDLEKVQKLQKEFQYLSEWYKSVKDQGFRITKQWNANDQLDMHDAFDDHYVAETAILEYLRVQMLIIVEDTLPDYGVDTSNLVVPEIDREGMEHILRYAQGALNQLPKKVEPPPAPEPETASSPIHDITRDIARGK
jgi:hypothetical protein